MDLKNQQKHLPIAYTFHSPVKPVAGPLPLAELWIYQEQTSVTTVYWDHPSAAENASMHSVNIRRSGVTCSYQLTKSTSVQPEWKVILRYCAIHWQGTAQDRTNTAEASSPFPALLWLQKSSHSLWKKFKHKPLISHTLYYRQKCKHRYFSFPKIASFFFFFFIFFLENSNMRKKVDFLFLQALHLSGSRETGSSWFNFLSFPCQRFKEL